MTTGHKLVAGRTAGANSLSYLANRQRRYRPAGRGQSLVEFALTLPLLLLLTVVMMDMGRAVYTYNTVSDCAREGARFGIVVTDSGWGDPDYEAPGNSKGTYGSAAPYVGTNTIVGRTAAPRGILSASQLKVTIDYFGDPDMRFKVPLTVTVEYPFQPMVAYLVGGATISIKGSSVMFVQ